MSRETPRGAGAPGHGDWEPTADADGRGNWDTEGTVRRVGAQQGTRLRRYVA